MRVSAVRSVNLFSIPRNALYEWLKIRKVSGTARCRSAIVDDNADVNRRILCTIPPQYAFKEYWPRTQSGVIVDGEIVKKQI